MGACIGKKSKKYSTRDTSSSDRIQPTQPKPEDNIPQDKPSSLTPNNLPATDGPPNDSHNDEYRISYIEDASIYAELQLMIDEQELINGVLAQSLYPSLLSATDTELEIELINLVNENLEHTNVENSSLVNNVQSNNVI